MKPIILAMLRVKNEERWIRRCLSSISDIVDGIVILDNGSTDGTSEIVHTFPKVLKYEYQKSTLVDEVKDKNRLLAWTLELKPDWILAMDGDEELSTTAKKIIFEEIQSISRHNPEYSILCFKHIYFWDSFNTYRIDRPWYNELWRQRFFTTWNQDISALHFTYHKEHSSGFHCGSIPNGIIGREKKIGVALKHYGYLDAELRIKKYNFYKNNDPQAFNKGYYDHLIESNPQIETWQGEIDEERLAYAVMPYNKFVPALGSIHQMAIEMAGNATHIMDVGCGAGHVGAELKTMGKYVVGIEPMYEAASFAKKVLDEVIVDRADTFHQEKFIGTFNTLMLLDVIEHVPEPLLLITNLRKYLMREGNFIISVPNVAHWTMRKMLLKGNFFYEDYGILDRNHLRFFTWETLMSLLDKAGLELKEARYAFWLHSSFYNRWYLSPLKRIGLLEPLIKKLGPRYPRLFAYQFLIKATLKN